MFSTKKAPRFHMARPILLSIWQTQEDGSKSVRHIKNLAVVKGTLFIRSSSKQSHKNQLSSIFQGTWSQKKAETTKPSAAHRINKLYQALYHSQSSNCDAIHDIELLLGYNANVQAGKANPHGIPEQDTFRKTVPNVQGRYCNYLEMVLVPIFVD